jgi:hypothetical protein
VRRVQPLARVVVALPKEEKQAVPCSLPESEVVVALSLRGQVVALSAQVVQQPVQVLLEPAWPLALVLVRAVQQRARARAAQRLAQEEVASAPQQESLPPA